MPRSYRQFYNYYLSRDRAYARRLYHVLGFVPKELALYRLAFRHRSVLEEDECRITGCNERLEYLGDAVLGAAVSELLFKRYPIRDEGWMTDMRSKIVSRKSLNALGKRLGLEELLDYDRRNNIRNNSLIGNSFEALCGAIYLDYGYHKVRHFIQNRILDLHIDLDHLENINENYKSQLMEFVQKHKLEPVRYELLDEVMEERTKIFHVAVRLGGNILGEGYGPKKKTAEQKASAEALQTLQAMPVEEKHQLMQMLQN